MTFEAELRTYQTGNERRYPSQLRMARPGEMRQQGSGQAEQMMRDLHNLMQRQQQLLDRSFRAQRRQDSGQQPGDQAGQNDQPGDAPDGSQPGDMGQRGNSDAEQMMRGMREMMQRQQQLLDRSFRAQRRQDSGQQPNTSPPRFAKRRSTLRR